MNRTHAACDHPATKAARAACRAAAERARSYDPTAVRVVRVDGTGGVFYSVMRGTEVLEMCDTRKAANEVKRMVEGMDLHFGCYGE